jgi:thiol:disulfide interchange protein
MRGIALILFSFLAISGWAQIYSTVKWTTSLKDNGDGTYSFVANAKIDEGWWVYSQFLSSDEGPIATTVNFDAGDHYKLVGKSKESDNALKIFDKVFEMEVVKFKHTYSIEQKIKISDPSKPITGYINFMTCNDERCLPPTDVDFNLTPTKGSSGDATPKKTETTPSKKKNETSDATSGDEKKNIAVAKPAKPDTSTPVYSTTGVAPSSSSTGSSKIYTPVHWTFRSEKKGEGLYAFIAEASIDPGWHIYAQGKQADLGPTFATFNWEQNSNFTLEGKTAEESSTRKESHDSFFDLDLVTFEKDARFTQLIKTNSPGAIKGYVEFMACDDSKCLPSDEVSFEIDLATGQPVVAAENASAPLMKGGGLVDHSVPSLIATYEHPLNDCGVTTTKSKTNLLWMLLFGIINGLVALLTPCVFPMIPLTVSFFTKGSKRKGFQNALIYGISIILIYVVLGLLITILFGAGSLNELSTNPIANTAFFIIFIVFAFSFFGFYEITLPSSWSNKSDAMADKGGLIGIFFMAATLAIVSFSCTGPLIGSALVEASSKGFMAPLVVMFGFSFALAVPFGLFAAFPSWLNSLPKSGGWMNSVKVILGFAELALAFKFLSVADMTAHWGILRYELFMGLWVLVALGMAAYMFGFLRFPHDSPDRRITPAVGLVGIAFTALGIYLATGLLGSQKTGTYNSLSLMSGLAPPAHYNFFKPDAVVDETIRSQYPSYTKCANNFNCFHDYYEGVAYAKSQHKPILLDFTGYGCVNCRKTEEHIWVKDKIWKMINEDFVLVSLYVDDKLELDSTLRSAVTNARIRTVGQIWTDFQVSNFKQNSQPLYVLVSPDEKVLTTPRGYDSDVKAYDAFLECGLNTFNELRSPAIGDAK